MPRVGLGMLARATLVLVLGLPACQTPADNTTNIAPVEREHEPERPHHAVIRLVAAGDSTCAVRDDGTWCWGMNPYWPFGVADRELPTPTRIHSLAGLRYLSFRGGEYCAVFENGRVRCWGDGRGIEPGLPRPPAEIAGIVSAVGVAQAAVHDCVWLRDETVACWCRVDTWRAARTMEAVPKLRGVVSIAAGISAFCARLRSGEVGCWNEVVRTGLLHGADRELGEFTRIKGLRDVRSLSMDSGRAGSVVDDEGMGWTFDVVQPFEAPSLDRGPVRLPALDHARAIVVNGGLRCILSDRRVRCGESEWRTPDGSRTDAEDLGVGDHHACLRSRDGEVSCVGSNRVGQLGDGTHRDSSTPVSVRLP
jgi:hypothetical protein